MSEPTQFNLDALFPCDPASLLAGVELAEFRAEPIKSQTAPCALELRVHKSWALLELPTNASAPGDFRVIARFRRSDLPSAEINVSVAALQYDVHLPDWTWVHLYRLGHKPLTERRVRTPTGELPDILSTFGRGQARSIARTTAIQHGSTLILLQGFAAIPEFESIARELVVTLASVKTDPPANQALIEARKTHALKQPAAKFDAPASWKVESKSCLTKVIGEGVLLTPGAPAMGPALIGIETATPAYPASAEEFVRVLQKALFRKGVIFGDPRFHIADGEAGPPTFLLESSGMTDDVSVNVTICAWACPLGMAGLWCICPGSAEFRAAAAIARRAFEILRESFQFTVPKSSKLNSQSRSGPEWL